jgi:FkbM family methyltransferase
MKKGLVYYYYQIRRKILKNIIPEIVWKKHVLLDDTPIPVRGMPFSFGVKKIITEGSYELNERVLIKEVISKGDQIIELGGSIGIVTAIMSEAVGEKGLVVAVEAAKELVVNSRKWLEPKGNVKIVNGIGFPVATTPDKYLNVDFSFIGDSLGGRVNLEKKPKDLNNQVKVYDLNMLSKEYDIIPNILVLDIEGSEIVFEEDNIEIPESIEYIIVEMHASLYGIELEKKLVACIVKHDFTVMRELNHVYLLKRNK